jgi:transcriptional regulator with XRE-family HTH domain
LGRDTAHIEVWSCDAAQGLLRGLAASQARRFAPLEEALVLRELLQSFGLSQHEVAHRSGRDVSWVSRRLSLLSALSDPVLEAVRAGTLSCWAATRVLAPLARANSAHAEALLKTAREESLSTRELSLWFTHYQRAQRLVRERMIERPRLFLQAFGAQQTERHDEQLRAGPEGRCLQDVRHLNALIGRVRQHLTALTPAWSPELRETLRRLHARLIGWCEELARYEDDISSDRDGGAHACRPEPQRASDRADAQTGA